MPLLIQNHAAAPVAHLARARVDPTQLHEHLGHCATTCSRWHRMRGALEAVDAFVSPRFVSSLVVAVLLLTALAWLLV